MQKHFLKFGVAALSLAGVGAANAQAIAVPVEITNATLSVAVIGAAVFAIAVGVKLYKWIKSAL